MSLPASAPPIDAGVQPHKTDAVAIVLGACILIIGLCSFTAVILLIQQLNRAKAEEPPAEQRPARRAAKATATTTQYRPLSEPMRRLRSDLSASISRQPSSALPLSSDSSPQSPQVAQPAAAFAPGPAFNRTSLEKEQSGHNNSAVPSNVAGGGPSDTSVGHSGPSGEPSTNPIDTIDIGLLSRIDQALASGVMRPQDAERLLKSFGCDLDELLREELDINPDLPPAIRGSSSSGGTLDLASNALEQPTPVLRASSAVGFPSAVAAASPPSVPFSSSDPVPLVPRGPTPRLLPRASSMSRAATQPQLELPALFPGSPLLQHSRTSACDPVRDRGSVGASQEVPAPSSGAATPPGPVIDDALLLKLDMALASGAVRPEQATLLLKSYGCDLEELLRDELLGSGEAGGSAGSGGAAGGGFSRKASSTLSL